MGAQPVFDLEAGKPCEHHLARARLDRLVDSVWERGLAVVTAPAGWGKSTLVAQFAQRSDRPVAWYRADATDSSTADLLRILSDAVYRALGTPIDSCDTPEELAATIEAASSSGRMSLVVDDVHNLASSAAGEALGRFISSAHTGFAIVLAGRMTPELDLSRRRVSGALVEISADDLRFRTWEAESLFRDRYRNPLRPEEIATLSARLEGWPAGLRLFHIATAGKPSSVRRSTLSLFGTRRDTCREYLTQNVLQSLPTSEHELLVRASVLGVLSGALCDEFLGATESDRLLAQLERRSLLTSGQDSPGVYRCHEVLRSHFETVLLDRLGSDAIRREYRTAGEILERHGHPAESVRSYCRAGDLDSAIELLGFRGQDVADTRNVRWEVIPAALSEFDPWILLARARRAVSGGDLIEAVTFHRQARAQSGEFGPGPVSAVEQSAVEDWSGRPLQVSTGWTGAIRAGVQRSPVERIGSRVSTDGPTGMLAHGIGLLLAGRPHDATSALERTACDPESSDVVSLAARLAIGVAGLLTGECDASAMDLLAREADLLDQTHIAHIAAAAASAAADDYGRSFAVPPWPHSVSGRWVTAVSLCIAGLRRPARRESLRALVAQQEVAADWLAEVDAHSLASWVRALTAAGLAELGDARAATAAVEADRLARSSAVPGARAFAMAARRSLGGPLPPGYGADFGDISAECGFEPRVAAIGPPGDQPPPLPAGRSGGVLALRMRCFGPLRIDIEGTPTKLEAVRPKARSVLRFLALHGGDPVHREVIVDALWPAGGLAAGTHSLQVAVSALRRLLEPEGTRGDSSFIERDGDSYRLATPDDAGIDLWEVRAALDRGRSLIRQGHRTDATDVLSEAVTIARGDLFPEEGLSDWIVAARSRIGHDLADRVRDGGGDPLRRGERRRGVGRL